MTDKEQQQMMKQALRYSSIGLELGAIYALLIYMGQRLDTHYGTSPWCSIGCFLFATICAVLIFVAIIRDHAKLLRADEKSDSDNQDHHSI